MNAQHTPIDPARAGAAAAAAGMMAAIATGAACIGPMIGIAFGIGGLGWLAQYAHLRAPASVLSAIFLAASFHLLYRWRDCACTAALRRARALLWLATVAALAINAFEYLILPRMG